MPARYAGPDQAWRVNGKTLPEGKLDLASFSIEGNLEVNVPDWGWKLECELYSLGKMSGQESIKEKFEPVNCAL